jgi:hypothetical protein
MYPTTIGATYRFSTLASAFLGATIERARIDAVLSYSAASTMVKIRPTSASTVYSTMNLEQLHHAIFPLLPAGTPELLNDYSFVLYTKPDRTQNIIALPWIDELSVQLVVSLNLNVRINNVILNDVEIVRQGLIALGYNSIEITTTNA